jgi:hypothetical protein
MPLVNELIETGARFLEEFNKCYPVAVAFWLKSADENRWHLHIASDKIKEGKTQDTYLEVLRITGQMKALYFDPFYVTLRLMDDPIVRFALDFQHRFPGRMATVFNVPTFEGVEVDGMYLYPPLQSVAA